MISILKWNGVLIFFIVVVGAVQFNPNPNSEMSTDERNVTNKETDFSDESGHEIETADEEYKEKHFLDDAMRKVLDPSTLIPKNVDIIKSFKHHLDDLDNSNITLDVFMEEMDMLSLEVCKTSQESLWAYVTDINNEVKKNNMIRIAAEEDEIKKQYWNILKKNYLQNNKYQLTKDPKFARKIRIIKERGTNVQMPQSKQREEIDTMQKIWSRVNVCAYNSTCNTEDSVRTMSDVISIFKTSNNSEELIYYWKTYRDATGKKIRPIFKDYVQRMNFVAQSENFTDAGDMWRYTFEDDNFLNTVDRLWKEIKPLYDLLQDYVRAKLKRHYKDDFNNKNKLIPAHILGNLWAQEWQSIYSIVAPYPDRSRSILNPDNIRSKDLFDIVDDFHQSLGFESANDSYQDIKETMASANCLPSSHDMCDGDNFKIKWCGEKVTDVVVGLSRAARLLGHVQYFKFYKNLPPLYRDGPNPAFHDAISDIIAIQIISPEYLNKLKLASVVTDSKSTINHLLWIALEKLPLMAYAYVLDKWRWDIFGNSSLENWNEHWWNLRINETGVSPPVPRNESDLDPAAKYHVVSHVQYITYLISHVLEFQILRSLCKKANHTGPLNECSLYGHKEAGKFLSDGMSLGASKDWRTVLKVMTGESELCTHGLRDYFAPLEEYLRIENVKLTALEEDMDKSAPIIVGAIVVFLTILIVALYCFKKKDCARNMCSVFGLSKNGSLDIVANELAEKKTVEAAGISEDKV